MTENAYAGQTIYIATQHEKEALVTPAFSQTLNADIALVKLDTDTLGTFSGEIPRIGSQLECVRRKCEWGLEVSQGDYGLASEGQFGPHPQIPFLAFNYETLYFIDTKRDFHLNVSLGSTKTNYQQQSVADWDDLLSWVDRIKFPTHAVILKPGQEADPSLFIKGIQSLSALQQAFERCRKVSTDGSVWVETDMRAHLNPSRQLVITELAWQLVKRLSTRCPGCANPGFGLIRHEKGLPCRLCGMETDLIHTDILGCPRCDYEQKQPHRQSEQLADPTHCFFCNP